MQMPEDKEEGEEQAWEEKDNQEEKQQHRKEELSKTKLASHLNLASTPRLFSVSSLSSIAFLSPYLESMRDTSLWTPCKSQMIFWRKYAPVIYSAVGRYGHHLKLFRRDITHFIFKGRYGGSVPP